MTSRERAVEEVAKLGLGDKEDICACLVHHGGEITEADDVEGAIAVCVDVMERALTAEARVTVLEGMLRRALDKIDYGNVSEAFLSEARAVLKETNHA
jgi:hypothetical protein